MRPRLFAIAVNTLTLVGMPAAGATLLGNSSQPHEGISARVMIVPSGAWEPFSGFTMDQTSMHWDVRLLFPVYQPNPGIYHDTLDALSVVDAGGRMYLVYADGLHYYRGYGITCVPRAAKIARCTLTYPTVPHQAPWTAVVIRITPAGSARPVTVTILPG